MAVAETTNEIGSEDTLLALKTRGYNSLLTQHMQSQVASAAVFSSHRTECLPVRVIREESCYKYK